LAFLSQDDGPLYLHVLAPIDKKDTIWSTSRTNLLVQEYPRVLGEQKKVEPLNRQRLKEKLGQRPSLDASSFHEIGVSVGWSKWQDVVAYKPDIVLMHWSAFQLEDEAYKKNCSPIKGNRCTDHIMEMLINVDRASAKPVRFLIYYRNQSS
jgi:hypothetical protein